MESKTKLEVKKPYNAPTLQVHGTLENITLGNIDGPIEAFLTNTRKNGGAFS